MLPYQQEHQSHFAHKEIKNNTRQKYFNCIYWSSW